MEVVISNREMVMTVGEVVMMGGGWPMKMGIGGWGDPGAGEVVSALRGTVVSALWGGDARTLEGRG